MEPTTSVGPTPKGRGSLENPEVYENVPGHVIPILEREFDDFDHESGRYLDGEIEENEFIGFRLKQGVYGQRQADVQMIRVKLPFGGDQRRSRWRRSPTRVEKYVPLNKGHITTRQNFQFHHVPLRDAAAFIRDDLRRRPVEPRGLRQHRPQRDRRSVGGRLRGRGVRPAPPTPAPTSATSCAIPTTQLMPRKIKTSFDGTPEDRAISEIHDIAFRARIKDGKRGFEMLVGGGTSIMPRTAPVLYDFVEADNGEYLEAAEAVLADLRPPGLAAPQPRPRAHQGVRRQVRHRRAPPAGRRGAQGRLGEGARLRRREAPLRRRRGGGRHEASDGHRLRAAERRPLGLPEVGRGQRQEADARPASAPSR